MPNLLFVLFQKKLLLSCDIVVPLENKTEPLVNAGVVTIGNLSSGGSRNVVCDASGTLSTAALTSGTVTSVQLNAGSGISLSGTNPITSSGIITVTAQDPSLTNEGLLGVDAGSTNTAIIRGYNSTPTATGTGVTISGGTGITVTESTSTNGGTVTLTAAGGSYADLTKPTTIASQTYDGTARKVDFDTQGGNMTSSSANDNITVNATGTYLVTYSGSFYMSSSGRMNLTVYKNSSASGMGLSTTDITHNGTDYYSFSKTFVVGLTSSDVLDLRFVKASGTDGNVTFLSPSFVVQRIL